MDASGICNTALGYLATAKIGTLGVDTSPQGVLCNTFYDPKKKAALETRNWTFAKKVWTNTVYAAADHPRWAGSCAVPADCLRVQRVDDGSGNYDIEFEKIGTKLNVSRKPATLYIEGVDGTCSEANFSFAFIFALAADLAQEMCIPLTENATLWASLLKVAEVKTKEASGLDGSQGTSEKDNTTGNMKNRR
jgi:hypothetical protein